MVSEQQIRWMLRNLKNLIKIIIENESNSLGELIKFITPLEIKETPDLIEDSDWNDPTIIRLQRMMWNLSY
jgi:hypothetical protein